MESLKDSLKYFSELKDFLKENPSELPGIRVIIDKLKIEILEQADAFIAYSNSEILDETFKKSIRDSIDNIKKTYSVETHKKDLVYIFDEMKKFDDELNIELFLPFVIVINKKMVIIFNSFLPEGSEVIKETIKQYKGN